MTVSTPCPVGSHPWLHTVTAGAGAAAPASTSLQDVRVPGWFEEMLNVRNRQISVVTNQVQQLQREKQTAEGHLKVGRAGQAGGRWWADGRCTASDSGPT